MSRIRAAGERRLARRLELAGRVVRPCRPASARSPTRSSCPRPGSLRQSYGGRRRGRCRRLHVPSRARSRICRLHARRGTSCDRSRRRAGTPSSGPSRIAAHPRLVGPGGADRRRPLDRQRPDGEADDRRRTGDPIFSETQYYTSIGPGDTPGPILLLGWSGDARWIFFTIDPGASASIAADGLVLRVVSAQGGVARAQARPDARRTQDYLTWCGGRMRLQRRRRPARVAQQAAARPRRRPRGVCARSRPTAAAPGEPSRVRRETTRSSSSRSRRARTRPSSARNGRSGRSGSTEPSAS